MNASEGHLGCSQSTACATYPGLGATGALILPVSVLV